MAIDELQLKLVSLDPAICRAWETHFAILPNVQIILGRFENVPKWDAIVAPGNSFGIMDGGLDLAIEQALHVEKRIRQTIHEEASGELPVGCALIEPFLTPDGPIRHVVYSPTMRIPMDIRNTENVYLAMKAALDVIRIVNRRLTQAREKRYLMRSVIFPALGMGTGRVPPDEGARQMALAYEYWLNPMGVADWETAVRRHRRITEGTV